MNRSEFLSSICGPLLARLAPTVFDVTQLGAVGDGSADATAGFQAALDRAGAEGGGVVYVPAGRYRVSDGLHIRHGVVIQGDGPASIVDVSRVRTNHALEAAGSVSPLPRLAADCARGDRALRLVSNASEMGGEILAIHVDRDGSWNATRPYYRSGEWLRVLRTSGGRLELCAELYDRYAAADSSLYRLDPITVGVRDLAFVGRESPGLIRICYGRGCFIEGVTASHSNDSCIAIDASLECRVSGCSINNVGDGGDDYGVAIANSQDILIESSRIFGRRHAVTTGGLGAPAPLPVCRNVRITSCILSNDVASGVHAGDFHGNSEDCRFERCTVYGGLGWGGRDNGAFDCRIMGSGYARASIVATEIKGGTHWIHGCAIETSTCPAKDRSIHRGIIDFDTPGTLGAISSATDQDVTISVENCTIVAPAATSQTPIVSFGNHGSFSRINVRLRGIGAEAPAFSAVLQTHLTDGEARSARILIEDVDLVGPSASVPLLLHLRGAYAAVPHRLQPMRGTAVVPAGRSFVDVEHCLGVNPGPAGVQVTPLTPRGGSQSHWVDGSDEDTFRIRVTPTADIELRFAWSAAAG